MDLTQSTPTKIRLKKTWFNPVYFHILKYAKYPDVRRILIYGSKSSAKTLSICQFLERSAFVENCSSIAYRKEQSTIKTTLKQSFKKSIELIKFDEGFTIMDFSLVAANGQIINLKGLDEEGKIKGIEGYKYLLFDELNHFSEDEWSQANISLRGMPGQKLFATWNPVDERSWIKKDIDSHTWIDLPLEVEGEHTRLHETSFVRISEDGKTILIKTTYLDNKWIVGGDGYGFRDENLIWEYEMLQRYDPNSYRINVLGEWGKAGVKKPAAYNFSPQKHISRETLKIESDKNIYFGQDFNVSPMATIYLQMWFDSEGHHMRFIDEIALFNSGVVELAEKLKGTFTPQILALSEWTGDETGNSRHTSQQIIRGQHMTNWKYLDNEFHFGRRLKLPKRNPLEKDRLDLMNIIFALHPDIQFSPTMKITLNELQFTEVDEEGRLIKSNRNKEAERSDFLDVVGYIFSTWMSDFKDNPRKYGV